MYDCEVKRDRRDILVKVKNGGREKALVQSLKVTLESVVLLQGTVIVIPKRNEADVKKAIKYINLGILSLQDSSTYNSGK
ncbi:hypothetical protein [Vibrio crassostreae]|uniref:hypothetical protein n=1 Tax=Vibrio crassostreae TaxID=246167 RepID=UPI001B305FFE|nr:hypothetical protein [Vibrio crassostreae]